VADAMPRGVAGLWVCLSQAARVLPIAMQRPILRNAQEQAHRSRDYSPQPTPRFASARASYPIFLSFTDTVTLQIGWASRGLLDAFRWDIVVGLLTRNVCFFFSSVRPALA
jgi:hypothetical protein